jgi:hypothetical protein
MPRGKVSLLPFTAEYVPEPCACQSSTAAPHDPAGVHVEHPEAQGEWNALPVLGDVAAHEIEVDVVRPLRHLALEEHAVARRCRVDRAEERAGADGRRTEAAGGDESVTGLRLVIQRP